MRKSSGELEERIRVLDTMLSALVEVLEQKEVITEEEWEKRIAERLKEEVGLVRL